MSACAKWVHPDEAHLITPDAWIWKDLGMGGYDFWDYSVNILNELNCDFTSKDGFDIDKYLPMDQEIGFFGCIVGGRQFLI